MNTLLLKQNKLFKKGFTLIELLVVIAIIGILTAIVTANFTSAKSKARDAKRISDIAQIQLAIEMVFDKCNVYPSNITNVNDQIIIGSGSGGSICTLLTSTGGATPVNVTLSNFLSRVPTDPKDGTGYGYEISTNKLDYILRAQLENNSPSLIDDIDNINITNPDFNSFKVDPTYLGCGNEVSNSEASNPAGRYNYCVVPK